MTHPYSAGDTVLVPADLLSDRDDRPYAYVDRRVLQVGATTVTVADFDRADAPDQDTKWVRADRVPPHNPAVLVLRWATSARNTRSSTRSQRAFGSSFGY